MADVFKNLKNGQQQQWQWQLWWYLDHIILTKYDYKVMDVIKKFLNGQQQLQQQQQLQWQRR